MKTKRKNAKKETRQLHIICWCVAPLAAVVLLVLDGCGLYFFTSERLTVLGVGLAVILLPFFKEISVKNFSLKRDRNRD